MLNILRLIQICVLLGAGSMTLAAPKTDRDLGNIWQKGDLPEMERLAEAGDVRAQHWMGLMLHNRGRYDEAIDWYARAVDQGDGKSANRIAFFFEHGIGRPKNIKEAMGWYRKGAALGDFSSQIRYASALRSGTVFAQNEREAFKWYAKAATERRFQPGYAYLPLAEMYEEGTAVPQNLKRAYALAKAAELTVDDSDVSSQEKARSLQATATAQMTASDLHAAEQIFQVLRPDLAERIARRSAAANRVFWLVLIFAAAAIGIFVRRTIRKASV